MRVSHCVLGLAISVTLHVPAFAAGGGAGGAEDTPADPQYTQAENMIKAHKYAEAIPVLTAYVQRVSNDANGYNLLGYASRKAGNLDAAFTHYNKALSINPKHRGAHEYIGEAYLMKNDVAKAEEHLKALDKLCTLPCEEYRDLRASIAKYKSKQTASK